MSKISITTLGDLIEFQRGYDLPKSEFKSGNVPVISSNGILGYHNEFKVRGPGITIGRSGTVGLPHFIEEDFFPHNTALFVKDFKGNFPKYIFYLIKTLSLHDRGSGSGVPTMNRNHLHPLKVSVYLDIDYQQKIASVLSALDSKISINNRINAELEAMAKTIYDYWFVQFDFPSPSPLGRAGVGSPYKTNGGKMVWSEELKREIPGGWEVKTINEVASVKAGGDKPKNYSFEKTEINNIPIYSNGITNDGLYGYTNKSIIAEQSITISARGTIGFCVLRNRPFVPIIRLITLTPNFKGSAKYFYEALKHFIFENSGSVQQQLTVPQVLNIKILYPKEEVLKQFDLITSPMIEKIEVSKEENQKLNELRDWLLPMLMNGQIKIKDAEQELAMAAEGEVAYKKRK